MKPRNRFVLSIALLLAGGWAIAAEPLAPSDFALRLPLTLAQPDGLHVIELTEPVYRASSSRSLSDLRIFNAHGEAMPWAVLPVPPVEQTAGTPAVLPLAPLPEQRDLRAMVLRSYAVRIERDARREVVEVTPLQPLELPPGAIGGYLIDARRLKDQHGQLWLEFDPGARDYANRVDIFGSDDLVNWRALGSGALTLNRALGEPVERRSFDLSRPPPFLRLQWAGEAPQLVGARFIERTVPAPALPRAQLAVLADADRPGSLLVEVPRALPIERLFFLPEAMNESYRMEVYRRHSETYRPRAHFLSRHRAAPWVPVGQVDVMRLMRNGAEVTGEPLAFGQVVTDQVRLTATGSARPQTVRVSAEWRPARIVFVAKAPGPYFLAVGNGNAAAPTPLDVRTALAESDRAGIALPQAQISSGSAEPLASQATEQQRTQHIATQARWSRYVLWAALLAAVAAMAWMAWRLSLQLRRPSAR